MKKKVVTVLQSGMAECAHACLAMVANFYGHGWTIEAMRGKYAPSSRGTSVSELVRMAQCTGFDARVYRAEPSHLGAVKLPCIVHWDLTHYVVLESISGGSFNIVDPSGGPARVSAGEMDKRFTGIVIELDPKSEFAGSRPERDTSVFRMVRSSLKQSQRTIWVVVGLALVLEIIALTFPLFIQVATDSILPSSDMQLLALLTAAFASAAVLQGLIALSRSSLLIQLGEMLTQQWSRLAIERLLGLPYVFFMRRSISDINSRFSSVHEIQRSVTHRFVESALDGATATIGLVVIFFYSPWLATMTLCLTALYAAIRIGANEKLAGAAERSIRAQSGQLGSLLEILHGVHSIKAGGQESIMQARASRKTRDAASATRHLQWINSLVSESGQAVLRVHWILAVAAGAFLAINGKLSAGMLVAYLTYATQFTTRSTRFLDLISEWRLLKLHGGRLAEILALPSGGEAPRGLDVDASGGIEVRELRFRYDADLPWVLDGVNFSVRGGECVAIKGVSGSGKSTLAKILIGLLDATSGTVEVGGRDMRGVDTERLRRRMACVLQDDQLFSGTIFENVAFFEPGFSRERVVDACKMAQVHEEIMKMPLRYDTRIIDLGASLSGGQKQRIMLARALYRQPEILVLDEASSHLDLENERLINDAINSLQITRIIIAHRRETLAIATRVVELRKGVVIEFEPKERAEESLLTV